MAKLIVLISSFIIFNIYANDFIIVSDLDDTIKITQVQSTPMALYNGLFTRKIFSGMNDLLQSMEVYTNKTIVLTSSPSFVGHNIKKLFKKFDLNVHLLITRNIFRDQDSQKYKFDAIENVILDNPGSKLILLGDNTDHDHIIYEMIQKKYPASIEAIYMHKVKSGEIPNGQKIWFSSIDIAYYEFLAGRLDEHSFFMIYDKVNNANWKNIIPRKLLCPQTIEEWQLDRKRNVKEFKSLIAQKIIKFCKRQ